jgi:hypothetical protein
MRARLQATQAAQAARAILWRLAGHDVPNPAVTVEPTAGPWKRNFNWGGGFNGQIPVIAGSEFPLFSNEEIPGPPRVQSIVLGRTASSIPGFNADFRAKVTYGIGATTDGFLCDWTRGAQFSLVANWVRVDAVTYAPSNVDPYTPTNATGFANVVISAGIAEGTVQHSDAPLTFTAPLEEVAIGGTHFFDAPDFARAAYVNVRAVTPAVLPSPTLIQCLFTSGTVPLSVYTYEQISTFQRGVLIPGGTRLMTFFNGSGVAVRVSVQWVLGL